MNVGAECPPYPWAAKVSLTIAAVTRALNRAWNPPIRGRHSKRRRIRKKAEKRWQQTPMVRVFDPNPLMSRIPAGSMNFGGTLTLPLGG